MSLINYQRGRVSRVADTELVLLSHTSSDHQVQFLVQDELGAIKQKLRYFLIQYSVIL